MLQAGRDAGIPVAVGSAINAGADAQLREAVRARRPEVAEAAPEGASLEVDPARASEPFPGLVVVPFQGHGFPRPDFVGEAELHLVDGKVARVVFRGP